MTSSYDDSVINFDLAFLQHSSSNTGLSRLEKQRKAILIAKQKTIKTDSLIKKYYDKKELLENAEKSLFASKEECKQVCIDYKNVLEKCERLENEVKIVQHYNQELQQKLCDAENQYCGIQSHARQLELLVKEQEGQIESLTLENNLEKANCKSFASTTSTLQRKNESLLRDLCLLGKFFLGKRKIKPKLQAVLQKYEKILKHDDDSCNDSIGIHSEDGTDVFEDNLMSPQSTQDIENGEEQVKGQSSSLEVQEVIVVNLNSTGKDSASRCKLDEIDRYSDCSNEIASADTGRGSSIAFSDSEKCFRSPDYFINDSHSPEMMSQTIINLNTAVTSPKRLTETTDIATSPIRNESPITPIITVDESVTSKTPVHIENIPNHQNCYETEVRSNHVLIDTSNQDNINDQFVNIQENDCLQVNGNNHYNDDDNGGEVEMILRKMVYNREFITPLPSSPSNSQNYENTEVASSRTDENNYVSSKEFRIMQKEFALFKIKFDSLTKEVMGIKQKQHLNQLTDNNPNKDKESNVDISELNRPFGNIDFQENTIIQNENHDIQNVETPQNNNVTTNDDNVEEVTQAQNENDSDWDDLIEMNDLVQIDENTPLDYLKDFNAHHPLMNDEETTDSLTLSSQVEVSECQRVINDEEKIISRLEFEEDASQSQPENSNNVTCKTPDAINSLRGEKNSLDLNLFSCNQRIKRKIMNSNKLERFRRKMIPKCKIQRERMMTSRKPRIKKQIGKLIRQTNITHPKKKVTATDSSASLNDKKVYDNAVKVMSQLKSKRHKDKINRSIFKTKRTKKSQIMSKNVTPIQADTCSEYMPKISTESMSEISSKSVAEISPKSVVEISPKPMAEISREPVAEISPKSVAEITPKGVPEISPKCVVEMSPKSASETSPKRNNTDSSESQSVRTEIPFDISDLLSKLTPKPILRPLFTQKSKNKSIQKNTSTELSEQQNKHFLKTMQPVILVDRIQDTIEVDQENRIRLSNIIQTSPSLSPSIITRSRSKCVEKPQLSNLEITSPVSAIIAKPEISSKEGRKLLKRVASGDKEIECKRILRSSSRQINFNESLNAKMIPDNLVENSKNDVGNSNSPKHKKSTENTTFDNILVNTHNASISYDDLDIFDERESKRSKAQDHDKLNHDHPKDSILCTVLEKYSVSKIYFYPKKIPDGVTNTISKLIEDNLKAINELPPSEAKTAMDHLVEKLRNWNVKQFLAGFMKFLQDPQRKVELYAKVCVPPAPPMTKYEQILLYIIIHLQDVWSAVDVLNLILNNIEYIMFKINHTPEFDIIESMSHFYAVICRYLKIKTRLRLFMLNGMYCMQYKAIVLIKQCIDVWMHVLPLAHMGTAKNPLIICVVYLLHFYKCEDHFHRVQDIRYVLNKKYAYQMSEWNETRILEMFRNAIYELKDIPFEKKTLRLSLIILAKRQGPRWCQKNIITNMLQPIIEKKDSPDHVKLFCVSLMGPLMKPYPVDMKVHCEIVMNLLLDMRKQNPSSSMEEAIFTSLIYMSRQNHNRVVSALLSWHPKRVSPEFLEVLRDFVREKPANAWKSILSKKSIVADALKRNED